MKNKRKIAIWTSVCAGSVIAAVILYASRHKELQYITGVVLRQDPDPGKQLPIPGVGVNLTDPRSAGEVSTDGTGLFRLELRPGVRAGDEAVLQLRSAGYRPMDIPEFLEDRIYVIRMVATAAPERVASADPITAVADLRIRYSVKSEATAEVGSAVKTFEVNNAADVPCDRQPPCSPDGKWKASIGGASLDAGEGAAFRDARVTCIAGPCPFTKVEDDNFSRGGRHISVTVRNWSDTATFVLEAEVMRTIVTNAVRQSFPVIFNRVMSFTLPASAEGLSIEATLNGESILFPLGPALKLSWATCTISQSRGGNKLYRCELKQGYQFGSGVPGIK